jgi:zinc protease
MTILIETDRSLPLVQLAVSAGSGAALDPVGKEGLTRLMSRLMRRTGLGLPAEQLDSRLDSMGGSLGADVGISSSGFAGSVIARSFSDFVEVVAGVVAQPGLDEEELARLQRESLDELLELRDSDRALARMWFRASCFNGHPYGRSTLGSAQSLAAIGPADVRAHYSRTIVPANLVFALAGDADQSAAEALMAAVTKGLPDGPAPVDPVPAPNALPGRNLVFVDKPERSQTQIVVGGLGTRPHDDDHTALLVANTVFGGTFTARLTQEIRAKRGWSYGANSSLPFDRQRQAFTMWTFPAATDAAVCLSLQIEMLEQWIDAGITQEELDWAKSYLVRSNVFNIDTAAKRMSLLLDESVYGLPAGYYAGFPNRVASVTLAEANAALRKRISKTDLLITVVGTHSEIGAAIESAVPSLNGYEVVSYEDEPRGLW